MKINALSETPESDVSHNARIRKRVLIDNGEIANITNFSQAVFPPGEIAHAHSHPDKTEVFFIESGTGVIEVDSRLFELEPGVCITVEPDESHEIRNTGTTNLVISYFGIITKQ